MESPIILLHTRDIFEYVGLTLFQGSVLKIISIWLEYLKPYNCIQLICVEIPTVNSSIQWD